MADCIPFERHERPKRNPQGPRTAKLRSAVTNGTKIFADGDHEGPWGRRFRDLIALHEADIGDPRHLSEAQCSLVRRVSAIEVQLETMEGAMSKGEDVDLDAYTRAAGHLRRILETLGINRAKRDMTPTVEDLIRERAT